MASSFPLSVVAPDRSVVETSAVSVVAPGLGGYFGVMAGHVPMVSAMRAGILEYRDEQDSLHHIYVGGGFVQVDKSGVTVLADEARAAAEVDIAEANALIETARRTLRGEDTSMTREEATVAIERATAQIKLGKR